MFLIQGLSRSVHCVYILDVWKFFTNTFRKTISFFIVNTTGISSNSPGGESWTQVRGKLKQVHVSPTSNQVWGVDSRDWIWRRTGITASKPGGTRWERIAGPDGGVGLKFVSVGRAGVWGVDKSGQVFYRTETCGDEASAGKRWVPVDISNSGSLKQITSGHGEVWGVNSNDQIFVRRGISAETPEGSGWEPIKDNSLTEVYVSSSSNQVWGVDAKGSIFRRLAQHLPTPVGQATQQCGKKGPGSMRRRDTNAGNRIIGGQDAAKGEFPWQVSIRNKNNGGFCGGTLIGNQHVLTAAHCLDTDSPPAAYRVGTGDDNTEKDHDVSEVHIHAGFKFIPGKEIINDIALLKLAEPVDTEGPYAGPACLPPAGRDYRGTKDCWLSGWGVVERYPGKSADRLQKVTGKIWEQQALSKQWGPLLPPNAVGFGGKGWSACMGDSGGPLVCPNGAGAYDVIGVTSFGSGTCSDKPGVFTEVAAYRDWLNYKSGGDIPA
ncbi:KLKB1 [Branchiostoma lanceolatum]|uniref:KLKB1 protein n=1 Tax=Branchiostoma lanceolatum TaxID=7740 RepID=A0A8K0EAA0_BRALA|nr:KLKB1 [Branchiostoma lanceolatum]